MQTEGIQMKMSMTMIIEIREAMMTMMIIVVTVMGKSLQIFHLAKIATHLL
jgi:hypothetical protein